MTIQEIPIGFCACGCGQRTKISPYSGKPYKMLREHRCSGLRNPQWKGGHTSTNGYPQVKMPGHRRASKTGDYVLEHILIAEKALGKPLPLGAVVHHHKGDKKNGALVICQDTAYHNFLHQRQRAYYACGHSDWRQCKFCREYDDSQKLFISLRYSGVAYHRKCNAEYHRHKRQEKL